jgi:hypothetical protein
MENNRQTFKAALDSLKRLKTGNWDDRLRLVSGLCALMLALVFVLLLGSTQALNAQTTAAISGTVTDSTGAVIPNAGVSAINEATQDKTDSVTGKAGTYTFPVLLPGTYTLKIQAKGFETVDQTGIVLTAGAAVLAPTAVLTVGSAAMTVTVAAAAGQVLQSENGQVGAVLEAQDIDNLALVSRTTLELLKVPLLPKTWATAWGSTFSTPPRKAARSVLGWPPTALPIAAAPAICSTESISPTQAAIAGPSPRSFRTGQRRLGTRRLTLAPTSPTAPQL